MLGTDKIPIGMGLCVPRSCANETSLETLHLFLERLHRYLPPNATLRDPTLQLAPSDVQPWDAGTYAAFLLVVALALCCLIGALVSLFSRPSTAAVNPTAIPQRQSVNGGHATAEPTTTNEPLLQVESSKREARYTALGCCRGASGCLLVFVAHFNVVRNASRMISVPAAQPTDCLNGMRVLSMLWIVLGHTFLQPQAISGYGNPLSLTSLGWGDGRQWTFQLIVGAQMAVDTFFYLSAFLFGHHFLAQLAKNRRLPNPMLMYVHRYLRLTPVMAFWLLLFYKLAPHLSDGPFWQDFVHSVVDKCDGSWWSQLLYIQNFYPWDSDTVCMGWTWYLGNDFIFYAISPFLVYAYVRHAKLGWLALATVLLGSLVSTWLVSSAKACGVYILNQVEYGNYTYWLYSKPWHRLPPWLVGLATSYIWRKQEHSITSALRKSAGLSAGIMCGSLLLMLAIVLAPASDFVHGDDWSPGGTVNNLYLTFSRLLWGLGCAAFSVCCFAQVKKGEGEGEGE